MELKRLLLVEGEDDARVLSHICKQRNLPDFCEIKQFQGVERLLESLPVQLKAQSSEGILGVVIDADENVQSRWQALHKILKEIGYENLPLSPIHTGTIIPASFDRNLPRFGIWIMPDNKTSGILEDFLKFLIPDDSRLFHHVKASVDGIPPEARKFSDKSQPKVLIHTWRAWQKEPGKPLGTAITAGYLDAGKQEAGFLENWLREWFEKPEPHHEEIPRK